jgi:hypothetical protein
MKEHIDFVITHLAASVPEGVPLEWQGRPLASGPLLLELDPDAPPGRGSLNYADRHVEADFPVTLQFPELQETLSGLGVDATFTRPVQAVLHSTGPIAADHGFQFTGVCRIFAHPLFDSQSSAARVLPGH